MQPKIHARITIKRIASKEVTLFFASPVAYLFLATFAGITLFVFFWGESFFARNISDVRPLFEWMPVLLIFLCSTLTMRLWSEERRMGTLEHVLTQPVPLWHFVVGKFVGCLFLLSIALLITLPLPITVAMIGELDWGPVLAGYIATLLMGAAYLSIGLFVSARSDNQIVSLITACVICGVFYMLGSNAITDFFGTQMGEWLRLLGTGSRFESITRGVIDLRDLYFYLSIVLAFLALNTYVLEKERWVTDGPRSHHAQWLMVTVLVIANAIGGNLWLGQLNVLRVDTTEGNQYTISDATKGYINQLQEPLLIRGYFSGKTHPLLAPLVPQMRDLINEYEIVGNGNIRVEIIDPLSDPEVENEANQKYGIQPNPFQVADRYQSSIVSSYFDVLVEYGDEYEVLGFRELIEVQSRGAGDIDVQLRNPEHDLTRAIKKVLSRYQSGGNLFDTVKGQLVFNAYVSDDSALPEQLASFKKLIIPVLDESKIKSAGRFEVNIIDPEVDGGKVAQEIAQKYGFNPMSAGLFSGKRFYFYLTIAKGDQVVQIPLDDITEDSFKRNLQAGIKRFASGFTKTVAWVAPEVERSPYGHMGVSFSQLEGFLGAELNVQREDLSDGSVSADADILVIAAPKDLDDKALFAIDQFLMQGGTIIAATSPYSANLSSRRLTLSQQKSGLEDWLKHHGLEVQEKLVLDPNNSPFPIPVTRNVGGFQMQEMRMLDYPYFIDVRGEGLNQDNLITSQLPQATLAWSSPITVDVDKNANRKITELLKSSEKSWLSSSLDIMPSVTSRGVSPFIPEGEPASHLLGVISQGRFDSFFKGKASPLIEKEADKTNKDEGDSDVKTDEADSKEDEKFQIDSIIERSPESARIVLIGSNDFLTDQVLQLAGSAQRSEYINTMQLIANAVDWSLEDAGLLSIRSRGHFNRTLPPMDKSDQMFWEYLNYGLAILSLIIIAMWTQHRRNLRLRRYVDLLV